LCRHSCLFLFALSTCFSASYELPLRISVRPPICINSPYSPPVPCPDFHFLALLFSSVSPPRCVTVSLLPEGSLSGHPGLSLYHFPLTLCENAFSPPSRCQFPLVFLRVSPPFVRPLSFFFSIGLFSPRRVSLSLFGIFKNPLFFDPSSFFFLFLQTPPLDYEILPQEFIFFFFFGLFSFPALHFRRLPFPETLHFFFDLMIPQLMLRFPVPNSKELSLPFQSLSGPPVNTLLPYPSHVFFSPSASFFFL